MKIKYFCILDNHKNCSCDIAEFYNKYPIKLLVFGGYRGFTSKFNILRNWNIVCDEMRKVLICKKMCSKIHENEKKGFKVLNH